MPSPEELEEMQRAALEAGFLTRNPPAPVPDEEARHRLEVLRAAERFVEAVKTPVSPVPEGDVEARLAEFAAAHQHRPPVSYLEWVESLDATDRAHFESAIAKSNTAFARDPKDSHTFEELGFTEDEVRVMSSRPQRRVAESFLVNPGFGPCGPKPAPAQTSEPRYFVCSACRGAFRLDVTPEAVAARAWAGCGCGRGEAGYDGLSPQAGACMRVGTEEVTALVRCGALSVYDPGTGAVLLTAHNRTARNVSQPLAAERVQRGVAAVGAAVGPALGYIETAVRNGAAVTWAAHYHSRPCGTEKTEAGEFIKREVTGDARFVGVVIAREKENEADGSILFHPVRGCARCGRDHLAPVPFWKLTRPVYHETDGARALVATHFAYCPVSGEPVMMLSTDEERDPYNFSTPARAGRVEARTPVDPIGGGAPIDGPRPNGFSVTPDDQRQTNAYEDGREAGASDTPAESNPFPAGSDLHREWTEGWKRGKHK